MPVTVAIVEDNNDYRMGTAYVLRSAPEIVVAGEYASAEDFFDDIDEHTPDVVLMDINLPGGMTGVEATTLLKKKYPKIEVIMFSVYEDDDNLFQAICAGASGYVTKPIMPQQLLEAVQQASSGGTPMSPHIARKVLRLFRQNIPSPKADYNLTQRELEILDCLVQGNDYQMTADKLFLSIFTVRAHIRNIYEKLHVHSMSQAVSKALTERLIPQK
ncbi:MAG: response regulator transcription factor [Ignavibacteriae bacterium]|nr:response regulator transcription factor [Ignavibacteriota bacterium]